MATVQRSDRPNCLCPLAGCYDGKLATGRYPQCRACREGNHGKGRNDYCAGCEKLRTVEKGFFICRECLMRLPEEVRRELLIAESWQHEPRRDALRLLGAEDVNDTRCPPMPREKSPRRCRCLRRSRSLGQAKFGGGETRICGDCELPIAEKA